MKDQGFKQSRAVRLGRGKIRGVGLFERIGLKITGRLDGMWGLPREEPSGTWTSPHLDREVRSYDEFASRMWGQLQIEEEDVYARLMTAIDTLPPQCRVVMQLTLEGLTGNEIAQRLQISPDTVKEHKSNGKQKLAVLLKGGEWACLVSLFLS